MCFRAYILLFVYFKLTDRNIGNPKNSKKKISKILKRKVVCEIAGNFNFFKYKNTLFNKSQSI